MELARRAGLHDEHVSWNSTWVRLAPVVDAPYVTTELRQPQVHQLLLHARRFDELIVDALRVHGAAAQTDIEELWRRVAFSILITNVDDHLLNHGFLHAGHGHWRLAPAFDLNPFPDCVRELKTWISPDTGPEATIDALLSVAPYFRIARARAREVLKRVERVVARWRKEGRALGMTDVDLEPFAPAFEHSERAAARRG